MSSNTALVRRVRSTEDMRSSSPPKILIVDDEKLVRIALVFELEEHGYHGVGAADGRSALAALTEDVQAVVVDHGLPDTDGLALLREIAALRPDLRAVMVTANGDSSLPVRAKAAGVLQLIRKPFEPAVVAAAVKAAVRARGLPLTAAPAADARWAKA